MTYYLAAFLILLLAVSPASAQTRTWRDNTGEYTIDARLVDVVDGNVRLEKSDGSLIVVPLERLSDADRRYLQSLSTKPRQTERPAPKPESPARKTAAKSRGKTAQVKCGRETYERVLDERASLPQGEIAVGEMLRQLSERHQIPAVLDSRALADRGIRAEVKVAVREQGLTLEETLNGSLKPAGLAWAIDHGVLAITTQEQAKSCLEPAVYKLLRPVDMTALLADIGAKIEPAGWDDVGGQGSRVFWPGGAVVIAQTSAAHRQIARQYAQVLKRIFPTDPRTAARGKAKPLAALTSPVTCNYAEMPLDQAVADLAGQSGAAIALDEKALSGAGIGITTPITFALENASLESALTWLLRPLGLTWVRKNAGIEITAPVADSEVVLYRETYDVRDLLVASGGNGAALAEIVSEVIAPDTWQPHGYGTIAPVAGGLQIQNAYPIHREIENLLAALALVSRP